MTLTIPTLDSLVEDYEYPQDCAELCLLNLGDAHPSPNSAKQSEKDFLKLYAKAKSNLPRFRVYMEGLGKEFHCTASIRPNGIKNLDRVFEKYYPSYQIPVDILGGKLVVNSLRRMYEISRKLPEYFDIVAFKDRCIYHQDNGYRDLQFIVNYEDHLCEIKIMHVLIDNIDKYEHRLYEIRRSIEKPKETDLILFSPTSAPQKILDTSQKIFLDSVEEAGKTLYRRAWQSILEETNNG